MTKRIVSGVFLLVALGALGLILAGALTSGEQLIVRFLTAVIVAALGLYVISDLRLQADDTAVAGSTTRTAPVASSRVASAAPPPNSTAAFMATVTGKKASSTAALDETRWSAEPIDAAVDDEIDTTPAPVADSFAEEATEIEDEEIDDPDTAVDASFEPETELEAETELDEDPYGDDAIEAGQWPVTPDGRILQDDEGTADAAEVDGLVAIFTKKDEREGEHQAAAIAELPTPVAVGGETMPSLTSYPRSLARTFSRRSASMTTGPSGPPQGTTLSLAPSTLPAAGNDGPPPPPPIGPPGSLLGGSPSGDAPTSNAEDEDPANPPPPDPATPGAPADEIIDTADAPVESARLAVDDTATPDLAADHIARRDETTPHPAVDTAGGEPPVGGPTSAGRDRSLAPEGMAGPTPAIEAATYARARVIDLRAGNGTPTEIDDAIRAGELDVITSLIDNGVLSTEGPLSDRDVRTMVYVAFTSSELRKILLAGGTVDGDVSALDLGPVEVFSDDAARPELPSIQPPLAEDETEPPGDGVAVVDAPNGTTAEAEADVHSATDAESSDDESDADDTEIQLATSD